MNGKKNDNRLNSPLNNKKSKDVKDCNSKNDYLIASDSKSNDSLEFWKDSTISEDINTANSKVTERSKSVIVQSEKEIHTAKTTSKIIKKEKINNKRKSESLSQRDNFKIFEKIKNNKKIVPVVKSNLKSTPSNGLTTVLSQSKKQRNISADYKIEKNSSTHQTNSEHSSNRYELLYNQAIQKNERLNLIRAETLKKAEEEEIESCTFSPSINQQSHRGKRNSTPNALYERQRIWNMKLNEKREQEKNKIDQEKNKDCTFTPSIRKSVVVNSQPNNIDKYTKKFLERAEKAKLVKQEIHNKRNPDYNEIYDKLQKEKQRNQNKKEVTPYKEIPLSEEENFATFNPILNTEAKTTYGEVLKTLHDYLHNNTRK